MDPCDKKKESRSKALGRWHTKKKTCIFYKGANERTNIEGKSLFDRIGWILDLSKKGQGRKGMVPRTAVNELTNKETAPLLAMEELGKVVTGDGIFRKF